MNIPSTVRIGPITYTVKFVDDLHDGGQNLLGWYRHDLSEIQIKTGMPDDLTLAVFWHECVHAMQEQAGQKFDEAMADVIGYGLVAMFESNGWRIETT